MEDMIINLASRSDLLIGLLGVTGFTTLSTTCSYLSKVLPDTIEKETRFLGSRVGALRGVYNPFMKYANKVAFNTGKAANNPTQQ